MRFLIFLSLIASISQAKVSQSNSCPSGQHFVKAHFRRSYITSSGKVVSATNVKAHCRVNPEGYAFWEPKLSDKKPSTWPHKKEVFQNWTQEEIERIVESLSDLPSNLWSEKVKEILRAAKSHDFPNPASSADGTIVIYDSAFNDSRNLARILAHELAHQQYLDLSKEDRKSYWYSLNWIPVNTEQTIFVSREKGYVQDDGRESPEEDFANNVESFLFEPDRLKQMTPHGYNWIKNHFGDKFVLRKGK